MSSVSDVRIKSKPKVSCNTNIPKFEQSFLARNLIEGFSKAKIIYDIILGCIMLFQTFLIVAVTLIILNFLLTNKSYNIVINDLFK